MTDQVFLVMVILVAVALLFDFMNGFHDSANSIALMVSTQLLTPQGSIMSQEAYNRVFTLHGVIMVFLFIIPSIPAALGNFWRARHCGHKSLKNLHI